MNNAQYSHTAGVFLHWRNDIYNLREHTPNFISITIPSRLVVFAWEYAKNQSFELKKRIGNSMNYFSCIESIFVNKLAELAYVMNAGFSKEDILHGESPIHLNYRGKDERFCISGDQYFQGEVEVVIAGSKKYCYPTVKRYSSKPQSVIYIDAIPITNQSKDFSRINIVNNTIKVTLIGIAAPDDMNRYQDQRRFLGYSNVHTAFVGLQCLRPVIKQEHQKNESASIPSFVSAIANATNNDIIKSVQSIRDEIVRSTETKPVGIIDYDALFHGFLEENTN